jgi:hypothetical protein
MALPPLSRLGRVDRDISIGAVIMSDKRRGGAAESSWLGFEPHAAVVARVMAVNIAYPTLREPGRRTTGRRLYVR